MYISEYSKYGALTLSASGLEAALSYSWPGNTRELSKFVEKTVLTYSKKFIDAQAVHDWIKSRGRELDPGHLSDSSLHGSDRDRVIRALNQAGGNRTDAAAILGIDPSTLFRKIRKFDLGALSTGKPGRPGKYKEIQKS